MKDISAAIVGAGALGSQLAKLLGALSTRRIVLIDPDRIEARNLAASNYLNNAYEVAQSSVQTGLKNKAELLAFLGNRIFPKTEWTAIDLEIADAPLQQLRTCDMIFSCTDNALARAETSLLARLLGLSMIDGGLKAENIHEGRVSHFSPVSRAACYLCQLSEQRRSEVLQMALATSLGCAEEPPGSRMGDSAPMAELVAARMIDMASRKDEAHSCAWRLFRGSEESEIALQQSSDCPWHHFEHWGAPTEFEPDASVRSELIRHQKQRHNDRRLCLQLVWPLCIEATCRTCGRKQEIWKRVAWVRRKGRCFACDAMGTLEPTRSISTISQRDGLAERSIRDLRFPQEHLFWCRTEFAK